MDRFPNFVAVRDLNGDGVLDLAVAGGGGLFLFHRAVRNMSFEITRRPSKQSRAFDQQRGDVYDHAHLVGAAYCDVFTCDKKMVKRLDGGREALGRKAPISAAGGIAALIKGIEGQLVS